jgi:sodium/potassium-transporting ATPase subunit alpha
VWTSFDKMADIGANREVKVDSAKAAAEAVTAGGDKRLEDSAFRKQAANIAAAGSAEFTADAQAAAGGGKGMSAADAKKEFRMVEHTLAKPNNGEAVTAATGKALWKHLQLPATFDPTKGLDEGFVTDRRAKEGDNMLTPPPTESELVKFLRELFSFFSCLLIGGGVLCFIGYELQGDQDNLYLGSVLIFVVVVTAVFGYYQNSKASKLMDSFADMMPKSVAVIRDGKQTQKNATALVRGDIVKLNAGDCVPADFVILQCTQDAQVDNAALTGESEPQGRKNFSTHASCYESKNVAFFGTLVPQGNITGMVVYCGDNTAMGRIARLATATDNEQTPINREIEHFVHIVSAIAIALGVSFFIIGNQKGQTLITGIVFAIGIIVANVPEGLLVTVTVCLTLTANRMHGKNVLVKNLEGVETLGSTSCICSDKTGTLTQNVMTVQFAVFGNRCGEAGTVIRKKLDDEQRKFFACREVGPTERKDETNTARRTLFRSYLRDKLATTAGFSALWRCSAICNDSTWDDDMTYEEKNTVDGAVADKTKPRNFRAERFTSGNLSPWVAKGNATDSGMLKLAQELITLEDGTLNNWLESGDVAYNGTVHAAETAAMPKFKDANPEFEKVAFNSKNKFAITFNEDESAGGAPTMFFKGAPERVMVRCNEALVGAGDDMEKFHFVNGSPDECNPCAREAYDMQFALSSEGYRVIGLAMKRLDPNLFTKEKETGKWLVRGEKINTSQYNFPIGMPEDEAMEAGLPADFDQSKNDDPRQMLTFLGLLALIDPHRPEVPFAVNDCKSAGIQVVMVTGDHPITAQAIAKNVGIIWGDTAEDCRKFNSENNLNLGDPAFKKPIAWHLGGDAPAIVVPGWEIKDDDDDALWKFRLSHPQKVFARTSPQQKLKIVENCQKLGHIVAVTGDGVNDSPALKKADIGCAMGIMGSEVSKEAADMILLDDNFASIVAGVQEGRLIFDNLKKSIAYTLSSNIPEISPFLLFTTIGIPLPLTTVLILCVDLGTDMIPAISMAYEKPESDIMRRNPRNGLVDRLVTKKLISFAYLQIGIIQAAAGFYTWMVVLNDYGFPPHILPGLGEFDNWSKQPLFCKLEGGELCNDGWGATKKCFDVNEMAGTRTSDVPQPVTLDMMMPKDAQGVGCKYRDASGARTPVHTDGKCKGAYPLWSPGKNGKVIDCQFLMQNYKGTQSVTEDVLKTNLQAGIQFDGNDGLAQSTAQSYAAAIKAQFVPYTPWRARASSFYDSTWFSRNIAANGWEKGGLELTGSTKELITQMQPLYTRFLVEDEVTTKGISAPGYQTDAFDTVASRTGIKTATKDNADVPWPSDKGLANMYGGKKAYTTTDFYAGELGERGGSTTFKLDKDTIKAGEANSDLKSLYHYPFIAKDTTETKHQVYSNIASRMMQKEALHYSQGAFWGSIVIVQWADLVICKTRWLSITSQGMSNSNMNFGLFFETWLSAVLAYSAFAQNAFKTRPIRFVHWFPAMPFSIFIFVYDETRKFLLRTTSEVSIDKKTGRAIRNPGWLEYNTYY